MLKPIVLSFDFLNAQFKNDAFIQLIISFPTILVSAVKRTMSISTVLCCLLISFAVLSEETFNSAFANYQKAEAAGDTATAVKYANLSYELGAKAFGENSENTVGLKYITALAYRNNNQPEQALLSFDYVLNAYEQSYGEFSEQVHGILLEILKVAELQRGPQFKHVKPRYLALMNKTINVGKKLTENSPEHAHVYYYRLAKVLSLPPLKFVFAKRSFAIHEQAERYLIDALGITDVKVVEMQFAMAKDLYSRKQISASIEYYKKVIDAFELESISTHPSLIEAHTAIVRISEINKNSEAATKHALAIGKMLENDDITFAKTLFTISPLYPKEMAREAKQGETLLSYSVDNEGFVKDIEVEKSSHPLFSRASKRALKNWRFAPIFISGVVTKSPRQSTLFTFKLDLEKSNKISKPLPSWIRMECMRTVNCRIFN